MRHNANRIGPGCRFELNAIDGPVHPDIDSTATCWARYGQVLAREYSDPRCMAVHHLTVHAYATQHPGQPSLQST